MIAKTKVKPTAKYLKCENCGDKCQFGKYYKNNYVKWNLLSIELNGSYFTIAVHTDDEGGGSCSSISVGKKEFLEYITKVVKG